MNKITIFWFRRDLRITDNCGLYHALKGENKVLPIFIYDEYILGKLQKKEPRVEMIDYALGELNVAMKENRCCLEKFHGTPKAIFEKLLKKYAVQKVITNTDYEPYATQRDHEIERLLNAHGIAFESYKDQVIFEKSEVTKNDGKPYVVYTPYANKWLENFAQMDKTFYPSEQYLTNLFTEGEKEDITLEDLGFQRTGKGKPDYRFNDAIIDAYEEMRNFPFEDATSKLGTHLRFGTVSIRKLVYQAAARPNPTFLKELVWREFFMQILWHFPHTHTKSFKPQYDRIVWRNNEEEFQKWCKGQTGYPFVDAGMRELNETGFMHNRARMIVGSFLCKHLLIDWRWGEAYFAEKLMDYEMSSNVGNWQWVAGCGVDAAPYFRIFNPTEQIKKFDKQKEYIQKWVPDYQELTYPQPIVDHKFARERCLNTYKAALAEK